MTGNVIIRTWSLLAQFFMVFPCGVPGILRYQCKPRRWSPLLAHYFVKIYSPLINILSEISCQNYNEYIQKK